MPDEKIFPRELTDREKSWLFFTLPEDRPGYAQYREKIKEMKVLGEGRFGGGNIYIGKDGDKPDTELPSAPVIAAGTILYEEAEVYVAVHEEQDCLIEIDISNMKDELIPQKLTEIRRWTYSHWSPGDPAPPDQSEVREIQLIRDQIVIAIAPSIQRIWVYEAKSGVNYFIPVSKFHNELMRIKKIKDPKTALNPNLIFSENQKFSDEEIGQAFLLYNKYWKKLDVDYSLFQKEESKKQKNFLGRLFSKRS